MALTPSREESEAAPLSPHPGRLRSLPHRPATRSNRTERRAWPDPGHGPLLGRLRHRAVLGLPLVREVTPLRKHSNMSRGEMREILAELGWSGRVAAEASGLSRKTIVEYTNGRAGITAPVAAFFRCARLALLKRHITPEDLNEALGIKAGAR